MAAAGIGWRRCRAGDVANAGAGARIIRSRPVTIIVPFTAGGPADTAARTISEALRHHLGQSLIAENRPAASGIPGTEAVALGEADGYTLLLGGIARARADPAGAEGSLRRREGFRAARPDLAFAAGVRRAAKLGVKTVAEFVAYAKANPGKVTIGSAGNGTVTHLADELLKRESGIELLHVPYRSTANSLTDLVGGHIDAIFGDVAILQPHVNSGAIRALAITSPERSPLLPDLATMAEVGFPGCGPRSGTACLRPARTPAPILDKLKAAVAAAQADPAFARRLGKYGIRPVRAWGGQRLPSSSAMRLARWTPIVTSIKTN